MDRRVTSPTWDPPPPSCKQALSRAGLEHHHGHHVLFWNTNMAVVTSFEKALYGTGQLDFHRIYSDFYPQEF